MLSNFRSRNACCEHSFTRLRTQLYFEAAAVPGYQDISTRMYPQTPCRKLQLNLEFTLLQIYAAARHAARCMPTKFSSWRTRFQDVANVPLLFLVAAAAP